MILATDSEGPMNGAGFLSPIPSVAIGNRVPSGMDATHSMTITPIRYVKCMIPLGIIQYSSPMYIFGSGWIPAH